MKLINKVVVNLKILVVEDEIIVAEDIRDSLECLGYSVTDIADSGKEAIAKAALTKPDLVLMNIRLKENMNGLQVAEKIWNNFNIPIIFLTAHSDIKTIEQAKGAPFGYISKPFRERELHNAIEMAIYKHESEKKLKYREQWVNTILTSISDAVIITDHKSCITLLNTTAELLTGWKQSDALGKNLTEVLHLAQAETRKILEIPIAQVIQQNVAIASPEQTILITKNGREIPINSNASPLEDEQGIKGVIVVFRDITERKQAGESRLALARNQQLEEQLAELERLNGLKDDFLSTVSHELRTPMANITMAVKMLELSLGRINELLTTTGQQIDTSAAVRYLKILKDECGREINLIENLLSLQRLEAGVQTFESERIQFQTWLAKVVEPFQERAHSRQQTLQINIPANLPSIVSDCASVGRIVAELLNNACKYTPPGEHIILTARAKNEKIQLQVCNSGVEIPEKELTRVFDKFYRVPSHDPWKQGGTGLGLALVQKLSEQLGGGIQVESGGGKTSFTVELPFQM
jgi:PAS domain S-box-containing protein